MRHIMNEALRRMYTACRSGPGFPEKRPPGTEVEDHDISIHAILLDLGLISIIETDPLLNNGYAAEHPEHTRRASDASTSTSTTPTGTMQPLEQTIDPSDVLNLDDFGFDLVNQHERVYGPWDYFEVSGDPRLLQSLT